MSTSYLVILPLTALAGLWVTFRLRSVDPRGRFLALVVGAAAIGLAFYEGLKGQPLFGSWQHASSPSQAGALSSSERILPHALALFAIMLVAMAGVVMYYAIYHALRERSFSVLRTRVPRLTWIAAGVGIYMYVALLPMSLVRHHMLELTDQTAYEVTLGYVAAVGALILVAVTLVLDKELRSQKPAVITFFCGLLLISASTPFVWNALATATPAAGPLAALSIFAMGAPAPGYFLLHYRLGWL